MTVWRYTAIERPGTHGTSNEPTSRGGAAAITRHGELSGETAAEVRAALRRLGLQVIAMKPLRRRAPRAPGPTPSLLGPLVEAGLRYQRKRRRPLKSELYDALGMMLETGLALPQALQTVHESSATGGGRGARGALRSMLGGVIESLRRGESLSEAMRGHGDWFEATEIAMIDSAQHAGELPAVLKSLAERGERADELSHKLASALAYPIVVSVAGLGVVVFLSVQTLPQLVQILTDAQIEAPKLTLAVMAVGGFLARFGIPLLVGLLIAIPGATLIIGGLRSRDVLPQRVKLILARGRPRVTRTLAVARLARLLAELTNCGIPLVEALRVAAPTTNPGLRRAIRGAADRLEQGDDLGRAFDEQLWFDAEFRRLLEVGQSSGELPAVLQRLSRRGERRTRRLIDRLTTLLEPAVILALATLVGVVVMAAVLPLVRLQEIL